MCSPLQRLLYWLAKEVFDLSYIYKNKNKYIIIYNSTDDTLVNIISLEGKLHHSVIFFYIQVTFSMISKN